MTRNIEGQQPASPQPIPRGPVAWVAGPSRSLSRTMKDGLSVPDYEDDTVELDAEGVRIKSYRGPGNAKHIPYPAIRDFEVFEMGFWSGRHRLVGLPLGKPRNWFHWDRNRRGKTTAIGLDVGRLIRPTIVPDDPTAVGAILDQVVHRS